MKVIFVDIDGVLNSFNYRTANAHRLVEIEKRNPYSVEFDLFFFDPVAVDRLNQITDETGAKLVISSSWRYMRTEEQLRELFQLAGVKAEVLGITDKKYERFAAIDAWLVSNEVKSYTVLDDICQSEEWGLDTWTRKLRQVKTNDLTGLLDIHVEMAVYHLENLL